MSETLRSFIDPCLFLTVSWPSRMFYFKKVLSLSEYDPDRETKMSAASTKQIVTFSKFF